MAAIRDMSLTDLRQMRTAIKRRMKNCDSHQNYVMLGRLLIDVNQQLRGFGAVAAPEERTGLSEFEKRLAERKSPAQAPARS
jgi:hypothetical protein